LLLFSIDSGDPDAAGRRTVPPGNGAGAAAPVAAPDLAATLGQIDGLHHRRDDPAALADERRLVEQALGRAPQDYEVLWRAARFYFWLSDDPGAAAEARSGLGKTGWDIAERAISANAGQPAGYYWAAVNMGSYALGLGVVKALTLGLEAKFKSRLERAEQLAPGYQNGGIDVAWGRFYEKLPWPKRDRKQAEAHLRRVLGQLNKSNLRARVYLADTLAHDNRAAEAKRLLDEVAVAPVGRYDAPEERRAKALGVGLLPKVLALMN
jgi:hypothetical protein